MRLGIIVLFLLAGTAHATDKISVERSADNQFTATLQAKSEISVSDAQGRILQSAAEACGSLTPQLGRYSFTSSQPLAKTEPTDSSFKFTQEFSCLGAIDVPVTMQSDGSNVAKAELLLLTEHLLSETKTFLTSSDPETFRNLHQVFSAPFASMLPLDSFVQQQSELHVQAGKIVGAPQVKVTTYVDPPGAPMPGTYLAIDFHVKYEKAPFRCGYVMWHYAKDGAISIIRLEDGIIYDNDAASLSANQLAEVKSQFRCISMDP